MTFMRVPPRYFIMKFSESGNPADGCGRQRPMKWRLIVLAVLVLAGCASACTHSYDVERRETRVNVWLTVPELAEQGGVEVLLREAVGAFEVTVLSGSSAQEVIDWLGINGYEQPPQAEPIIAEYVAAGFVFAAVKLTGGAGVGL